jgi:hypothetical protein
MEKNTFRLILITAPYRDAYHLPRRLVRRLLNFIQLRQLGYKGFPVFDKSIPPEAMSMPTVMTCEIKMRNQGRHLRDRSFQRLKAPLYLAEIKNL